MSVSLVTHNTHTQKTDVKELKINYEKSKLVFNRALTLYRLTHTQKRARSMMALTRRRIEQLELFDKKLGYTHTHIHIEKRRGRTSCV